MLGRFAGNFVWQYLAMASAVGAEFVIVLLVNNALELRDYGLLSFGYAFAFIFHQLCDLRLTDVVIKFLSQYVAEGKLEGAGRFVVFAFAVEATLRLLALLVNLTVISFFMGHISSDERTQSIAFSYAFTLFFNYLVTNPARGVLRVFNQFRLQAGVAVLAAVLKVSLVYLGLYCWKLGVVAVAGLVLLATLPLPFIYLAAIVRVTREHLGRLPWTNVRFSEHTYDPAIRSFTKYTYLASLTMLPTQEMDTNVLTLYCNFETVGLYKLAKNFVSGVWIVTDAIFMVLYPEFVKLVANAEYARLRLLLLRLTPMLTAFGLVTTIVSMNAFPWLVAVFFKKADAHVLNYFNLMMMSMTLWTALVWLNPLILARGRADLFTLGSFVGSLIVACLYFYLIPSYGAWGASLATSLSSPVVVVVLLMLSWKHGVLNFSSTNRER